MPPSPWSHPTFLDCTEKQQRFIRAYLVRPDSNASAAWRDAGLPSKSVNVVASMLLKRMQTKLNVLRPVFEAYQSYLLTSAKVQEETPLQEALGKIVPPTLTRKELAYIFSQMARGKDPHPPAETETIVDEYGNPCKKYPVIIRAQDILMAGKALMELKGWSKAKLTVEGNSKKPITHQLKGRSTEEIQAELKELRERNSVVVPALIAVSSTKVEDS